jgi:hypothetical protein
MDGSTCAYVSGRSERLDIAPLSESLVKGIAATGQGPRRVASVPSGRIRRGLGGEAVYRATALGIGDVVAISTGKAARWGCRTTTRPIISRMTG